MLASLIASLALLCLSVSAKPQPFEAYLLCADTSSSRVNAHYLHPLKASTINPVDPKHPPRIDFNQSSSKHLMNTRRKGYVVDLVHSERRNNALMNWNTEQTEQYISLNITDHILTLDWAFTVATGIETRLTYVESLDQYWGFDGQNNIGSDGDTFVLSIYGDVIGEDFDGTATFNTSWMPSDTELIESWDITSDSANQQLFIAVANAQYSDSTGLLLTYDIKQNKLISNITYGAEMRIKFSSTRKVLFSAQFEDNRDGSQQRVSSIEEVDPSTGKSRVIIPSSNLPDLYGLRLDNTYDDLSGEWYFVWTNINEDFGTTESWFFSINIDTKKVMPPAQLIYDWTRTVYLGMVIKDTQEDQSVIQTLHASQ